MMKSSMFRVLILIAIASNASMAFGQTLDDSIESQQKAVEQAKQKVIDKYNELILKAEEKGDSDQVGKLREFNQIFTNKGVMIVPEGNTGIVAVYKGYGASIKTAGDALRSAYIQEIKSLTEMKDIDGANVLSAELEQRLLPEKLVSFQLAVAPTQYMDHWALLVRGHKPVGEGGRMNATFEMRAGLSNPSFVSIHSVNWPTAFIQGLRILSLGNLQEQSLQVVVTPAGLLSFSGDASF